MDQLDILPFRALRSPDLPFVRIEVAGMQIVMHELIVRALSDPRLGEFVRQAGNGAIILDLSAVELGEIEPQTADWLAHGWSASMTHIGVRRIAVLLGNKQQALAPILLRAPAIELRAYPVQQVSEAYAFVGPAPAAPPFAAPPPFAPATPPPFAPAAPRGGGPALPFNHAALAAARKSGIYERSAPVAELSGDLAALSALVSAAVTRRSVLRGIAAAWIVAGMVGAYIYAGQNPMYPLLERYAPALFGVPPALVFWFVGWLVTIYDPRRVALVQSLVSNVAFAAGAPARLRMDLRSTQRRANRVPGAQRGEFAVEWLTLDATLTDGANLHIARREALVHTVSYQGRNTVYTWAYSFIDTVGVAFLELRDQYRSAGAPNLLGPHMGTNLTSPYGGVVSFQAGPHRVELVVRSSQRWTAEEGSRHLRTSIAQLYDLAHLQAPVSP